MSNERFDDELPTEMSADLADELGEIIQAAVTHVAEQGTVSGLDVIRHLDDAGLLGRWRQLDDDDLVFWLDELFLDSPRVHTIEGDVATFVSIPRALDGRTFTHRLSAAEIAAGVCAVEGNGLTLLDWDRDDSGLITTDGEHLTIGFHDHHAVDDTDSEISERDGEHDLDLSFALTLPASLRLSDGGTVIGITRVGVPGYDDDALPTVRVDVFDPDEVGDGAAETAALADALRTLTGDGVAVEIDLVLLEVIATNDSLFRTPVRPVAELLAEAGFARRGAWWGPADVDWQTPGEHFRASQIEMACATYGLRGGQVDALRELHSLWIRWSSWALWGRGPADGGLDETDFRRISELVGRDLVGLAFFDLCGPEFELPVERGQAIETGPMPYANRSLIDLCERLQTSAARATGTAVLCGWLAELADLRVAEHHYREALRLDPNNGTALVRLMACMVDASRFDEAVRLLDRLFGPGSPNSAALERFAAAMITAARNETCPCGSGRKYKQCHQNTPLLDGSAVTGGLIYKLERHTEEAVLASRFMPDSEGRRWWASIVDNDLARDVMVHEGGYLDHFLDRRLDLLPPDELQRLRTWTAIERDLYEVVEVDPGLRLRLRNVRTGDTTDVVEHLGSLDAQIGEYRLARIEEHQGVRTTIGAVGAVPFGHVERVLSILDHAIDPADELIGWVADMMRPPQLVTRDGEPTVVCEATVATAASIDEAAALLDDRFGRGHPADEPIVERSWTDVVEPEPGGLDNWVRSTFRVERAGHHTTVVVETTSEARLDRALSQLHELLPSCDVIDETRTPFAELAQETGLGGNGSSMTAGDPAIAPEIAEFLDGYILEMEQKWLDEQIPVLGGLTPREAAADPTRRGDLIRLLDQFSGAGPGSFDADRLRSALGLE